MVHRRIEIDQLEIQPLSALEQLSALEIKIESLFLYAISIPSVCYPSNNVSLNFKPQRKLSLFCKSSQFLQLKKKIAYLNPHETHCSYAKIIVANT